MAQFAVAPQDENLTSGWNVQGNAPGGGTNYGQTTIGAPGSGYGQAANTTLSYGPGQVSAGLPQPPGALNVGSQNSGSQTLSVLLNAGYADATGAANRTLPANIGGSTVNPPAVPATTVLATNPTSLAAQVVITGGTLTVVKVGVQGTATYAAATQVGTTAGTYIVPPGGVIGITYSAAPTWTWTV